MDDLLEQTELDFYLSYQVKTVDGGAEIEYEGIPGVFVEGYMTVFAPRDRGGENWDLDLSPNSSSSRAIQEYFKTNPIVLFEHGKDKTVGRQALGKSIKWKMDNVGIWVKDFIPKPAEGSVLSDIYLKIKAGIYQTFSVGGTWRISRKMTIVELGDLKEHSVVSVPMQGKAVFSLTDSAKSAYTQLLSEKSEATASKTNGVTKKMDDEKKLEDQLKTGASQEDGSITIPAAQAKDLLKMLDDHKSAQLEIEAEKQAKERIAKEEEATKSAALAEEKANQALEKKIEEKMASWRSGTKMLFGGSDTGAFEGGRMIKSQKSSPTSSFSFVKFAQAELQGRGYDYMDSFNGKEYTKADGTKAQTETIGSQGGYLVPEEQSDQIIDILRTQAVVRAMGARVITMNSDTLTIPRLVGDVTAFWGSEGSTLTPSQATVGVVRLVARKLYAVVQVTREMMRDANPSVEALIRTSIGAKLALEEDNAFINGTGINEMPRGILNTTGVNTIAFSAGAATAAPELKALVKAAAVVRNQSARPTGWIMNPRVNDDLVQVVDGQGNPAFANVVGGYRWMDMNLDRLAIQNNNPASTEIGNLLGLKQALTTQIACTATTGGFSTVIVGDWTKFIIGERQGIEIELDRSIGFLSDTIYLKATRRVDCVVAIPESFCTLTAFPAIDVA